MPLSCELLAPGEPVPSEWDRFVGEQALLRAWDGGAFAALAAAGQGRWLGMVHEGGRPVGLVCGRLRGRPGPAVFECRMPWVGLAGFALAAELDQADRREALATFERALRRRLGWRCPGVLYSRACRSSPWPVVPPGCSRTPTRGRCGWPPPRRPVGWPGSRCSA